MALAAMTRSAWTGVCAPIRSIFPRRCRAFAIKAASTTPLAIEASAHVVRLQQGIPHTLLRPPPDPDTDRVPLAIALTHVPPGQPARTRPGIPFRNRRLSPAERTERSRSGGRIRPFPVPQEPRET